MTFKLYYNLISQPSRSLYMLLKISGIQFEKAPVELLKGAQYADEYTKINRFQKVPVIDHDGFILTESVAILRYLASINLIPDKLYPSDPQGKARVDEFLEWHHIGLRAHCALFAVKKHTMPAATGIPANPDTIKKLQKAMETALDDLEIKWLGRGMKYIVADHLTVADLWAASEVEQPRMTGFDPMKGRPNITNWLTQLRTELDPYYKEAHLLVNKIAEKSNLASKI